MWQGSAHHQNGGATSVFDTVDTTAHRTDGFTGGFAVLFGFKPLRRVLISTGLLKIMRNVLPVMGETERIALEACSVVGDGVRFSGDPDWKKLRAFEPRPLTSAEQVRAGRRKSALSRSATTPRREITATRFD